MALGVGSGNGPFAWLDPNFLAKGMSTAKAFSQFPNWFQNGTMPSFKGSPGIGAVAGTDIQKIGLPWVVGLGVGNTRMVVWDAGWEIMDDDLPYYAVGFPEHPSGYPLNQWLQYHFGDGSYWFWKIKLAFSFTIARTAVRPQLPAPIKQAASLPTSNALGINFSTSGQTIPYSYGARRLDGFKLWAKGIESSDQTVDGIAYATFADTYGYPLVLGEDIYVNQIWFDGNLAWTKDGGVQLDALGDNLNFRVYTGTETQLPDPDIIADKGVTRTPGFRRQIYIIFFDIPLSAVGNRFPTTSVEIRRVDENRINVADALVAVGQLGGVNTVCEGIDDQADGVVFKSLSPRTVFTTYRDQYGYRIVDGDPVRLIRRAVGDALTIDAALAATGDIVTTRPDDDVVAVTRTDDTALPNQIELTYNDVAINYQQGEQQFRRPQKPVPATTSHLIQRLTTEFIISANEAIAICADVLYRLWSRRVSLKFTAAPHLQEMEEADILSVPTSQGVLDADVTRRSVMPDQSVQTEMEAVQAASGANLFADSGSILSQNLFPCRWPDRLWSGGPGGVDTQVPTPHLVGGSGFLWSIILCDNLWKLARASTLMPSKVSQNAVIGQPGLDVTLPMAIALDGTYVYVTYIRGDNLTAQVLRVSRTNAADVQLLDAPISNPFRHMQAAVVGQWLFFPIGGVHDSQLSQHSYLVKIDTATMTVAEMIDLGLPSPSPMYWHPRACCGGDGVLFFSFGIAPSVAGSTELFTPVTTNRIYRYETWSGALSYVDTADLFSGGVYINGSAYLLPDAVPKYSNPDLGGDGSVTYNYKGVRVDNDLSLHTFDIRDDPNVTVISDTCVVPWTDGTYLYFTANSTARNALDTNFLLILDPYIARRKLADLSQAGGAKMAPYMDASAYRLDDGVFVDGYHYLTGAALETGSEIFVSGGSIPKYGPGIILRVLQGLNYAVVYPNIQSAAQNDDFPGAPLELNQPVTTNNEFATKQPGEPNHAGNPGGRSLWWTFTAATGQWYEVQAYENGNAFGNQLFSNTVAFLSAVYSGNVLTGLVERASSVNNRIGHPLSGDYTLAVDAGEKLRIVYDGYFDSGTLQTSFTNVTVQVTPLGTRCPNDNFVNAQTINAGQTRSGVNNRFATKEAGEPDHDGNPGGKSVWYKFTAPHSHNYKFSTDSSKFANVLAVYTGSAVNALTPVNSGTGDTTDSDDYAAWGAVQV